MNVEISVYAVSDVDDADAKSALLRIIDEFLNGLSRFHFFPEVIDLVGGEWLILDDVVKRDDAAGPDELTIIGFRTAGGLARLNGLSMRPVFLKEMAWLTRPKSGFDGQWLFSTVF